MTETIVEIESTTFLMKFLIRSNELHNYVSQKGIFKIVEFFKYEGFRQWTGFKLDLKLDLNIFKS